MIRDNDKLGLTLTTGITCVTPSPESITVPVSVRSDVCFDVQDAASASTAYTHTHKHIMSIVRENV